MSDAPPPPPLGDPNDDRSGPLRAYAIAMTVFSILALAMRFTGRSMMKGGNRFWWDDWAALASLPTIFFVNGITLALLDGGLGRHMDTITDMETFLFMFFISYFSYDLALFATKAAALLFLSRVFPQHANARWFNYALWFTHLANFAWLLGTVFATAFFCDPIERNWDMTVDGTCGNTFYLMLGSSISSVIIDLMILLLPMPKIWGLKMDVGKKSGLTGVFIVGYLVVVVSVGRLIIVTQSQDAINRDLSWEIAPVFYWFVAEAPVTLLCICLPASLPIIRRLFGKNPFGNWSTKSPTKATYGNNSRDRSGGSVLASKNLDPRWREDPESINMDMYGADKAPAAVIGQAVTGRDSLDSDGSNRGILPQGNWHSAHIRGGNATVSDQQRNMPEWSIRVDHEVTVQR